MGIFVCTVRLKPVVTSSARQLQVRSYMRISWQHLRCYWTGLVSALGAAHCGYSHTASSFDGAHVNPRRSAGGRGVACGGDGGELLSLYDIRSCATRADERIAATVCQQGIMISQANLGHRATTVIARGQCLAVAGPSSNISVLRCKLN